MREELIRKFAPQLGIDSFKSKSSKGWMETRCVLAPWTHDKGYDSSPSFAIKINPVGKSAFVCQSCKHHGSIPKLAYQLYGFTGDEAYQTLGREIEEAEIASIANSIPEWDDAQEQDQEAEIKRQFLNRDKQYRNYPCAWDYKRTLDYMATRGLRPMMALKLGLRYDYAEDRLVFPIFDRNYELRGFVGRAMYKDPELKIKEYPGLNKQELLLGEHKVFKNRTKYKFVIVVEGPLDYAKVYQSGYENVLGLLGSALTPQKLQKLVDLNLPIIWMVDDDAAGYAFLLGPIDNGTGERDSVKGAFKRMNDYLPQFTVTYPKKKKDPGECNQLQIQKMVKNAELYLG